MDEDELEDMGDQVQAYPPKPASEHVALAYEWNDPKNPDYIEYLFDVAEAHDSRD